MSVWWWPSPAEEGETVPDYPPMDLGEYIVEGSVTLEPDAPDDESA